MHWFRRRHFLIDSVQHRLLVINLAYFLCIILAFTGVLLAPVMVELQSDSSSWNEQLEAANLFLSLHTRLWPAVIVLLLLLGFHSVLVTHRIAGPLYRFRKVFKSIAEGDLSIQAGIRKRDYLAKEADSINRMLEALRERVRHIQENSQIVSESMVDFKNAMQKESREPLSGIAERLDYQITQVRESVGQLKTGAEKGVADSQDQPPVKTQAAVKT